MIYEKEKRAFLKEWHKKELCEPKFEDGWQAAIETVRKDLINERQRCLDEHDMFSINEFLDTRGKEQK